jgi:hypothetical protein
MRLLEYSVVAACLAAVGLTAAPEIFPTAAVNAASGAEGTLPRGAVRSRPGAEPGYILFSPLLSTTTYLIDRAGKVVHSWESEFAPGASVYLLDDGHLLRCSRQPDAPMFRGGGQGGRLEKFDWNGKLVWEWVIASKRYLQHHDIEPLPNGNVLLIAWDFKTKEEAVRAGRDPAVLGQKGLWPVCILEVQPRPPDGGRVVWEWHLWDHLIQDRDPKRANYGDVRGHPELVDINGDRARPPDPDGLLERLKALGYIATGTTPEDRRADFLHTNSIAYNPELDQIALSVNHFGEIWIIDHGITIDEARGHTGGRRGKGGDLLYRWGNPRIYRRGTEGDQVLFGQHDARWIPAGYPGAGNLMVFNNEAGGPTGGYSSVIEFKPPLDVNGGYSIRPDRPYGPRRPAWEYTAREKRTFFGEFISGAHRLRNGNTFISSGPRGRFFEVTPDGRIVWEYRNPYTGDAPNPAGDPPYSVFRATLLPADHPALAKRLSSSR